MSIEKINEICAEYGIKNYIINEDLSIDVDGSVDLSFRKLDKIPLKFRNVTGSFDCYANKLKSLNGSPSYVGGYFDCYYNILESLDGIPLNLTENNLNLQANFTYSDYLAYCKVAERDLKFKKLLK